MKRIDAEAQRTMRGWATDLGDPRLTKLCRRCDIVSTAVDGWLVVDLVCSANRQVEQK